jgi:hypothetical protein
MSNFQIVALFLLGLLTISIILMAAYLILGNTVIGLELPGISITNPSRAILGRWERLEEPTPGQENTFVIGCDFGYPQNIEFFSDGTYAGMAISLFSDIFIWQGGEYEILEDGRVKIQTRNGFAVYTLQISGDRLTFVDDNDCQIIYQRASSDTSSATDAEVVNEIPISPILEVPLPTSTMTMTWTPAPEVETPTRTRAPTWTLLPELVTPTRTKAPTWTPLR